MAGLHGQSALALHAYDELCQPGAVGCSTASTTSGRAHVCILLMHSHVFVWVTLCHKADAGIAEVADPWAQGNRQHKELEGAHETAAPKPPGCCILHAPMIPLQPTRILVPTVV
jgi:hypothetical protein